MRRGAVHWADLGEPRGSGPAGRRPVLVVQADSYNATRLRTVVVVALTRNTRLGGAPGNVLLPPGNTGLSDESVANVTALLAVDRRDLDPQPVGAVPGHLMEQVDDGLRRVLALR